ncbi:MAG: glycerate kinase [Erysipelotrichaceae bacterium]|nr:glycerate kinase [Erysipelotrichaceae bacterium]
MSKSLLNDAKTICLSAIASCLPEEGVKKALTDLNIGKEVYLVSVGKAAFSMAKAASEVLKIKEGILISKYGHIPYDLEHIESCEAGHPVPDENSIAATEKAIRMCSSLKEDDIVVFLLSGGASALFESPLIDLQELQEINEEMLKKGLSIFEINTIRKKLSKVKGGRFADLCKPAKVYSIILSDVLSDRLDTIGSGPTVKDESDPNEALKLIDRYGIHISEKCRKLIGESKSGEADNASNIVIGSVRILCQSAVKEAEKLGYRAILIDDHIDIEARKAGDLLYEEILKCQGSDEDIALIMGGETIVHVKGKGKGGRNQELVFSQIGNLKGMDNALIMSLGSDGTDGPTDAAGGYVDGSSYEKLKDQSLDWIEILDDNNCYYGLKMIDSLIITGPTGTNVNDITIALIERWKEEVHA